jgi:outer membrane protein assembly factor BamB
MAADESHLYTLLGMDVAAYDLDSGTQIWRVPRASIRPSNVVASQGRVFVSSSVALALDAETGNELWRFTPDSLSRSHSTVDERAFYFGTRGGHVYALDAATGQPFWATESLTQGPYPSSVLSLATQGDTVYASLIEDTSPTGHLKRGIVVALDRHTGAELSRHMNEHPTEARSSGEFTVVGRLLLVSDLRGGAFFAVDRFTGQAVWRQVGDRSLMGPWDFAEVVDGVGYIASGDTYVYAFDPETGHIHWKRSLGGSANSSTVCGGHVFATAGLLRRLRRSDGQITGNLFMEWDGTVGNEWVRSRLLSHGNRVYFVGNKAVYAVSCG